MHRSGARSELVKTGGEFNSYLKRVTASLDNHSPQSARALEEIENHLIDA